MLSGIGPADHLFYHGIQLKVNLPVGKSLQSHVGTGELQFTVQKPVSYNIFRYITNPVKYILPYFTQRGKGPLAAPAAFDVIGNVRTGLDNTTRLKCVTAGVGCRPQKTKNGRSPPPPPTSLKLKISEQLEKF